MIRRFGRSMLLAALVIVLATAGTACGGGDESAGTEESPSASATETTAATTEETTYRNTQYGFEITYTEPLSQLNLTDTGGAEYAIAFVDKDGPTIHDDYANGVRISVFKLPRAYKAAEVPKLRDPFERAFKQRVAGLDGGKVTSDVTTTEINGVPGFTANYRFTEGGEQLACRFTVLVKGKWEYDLNEQTLSDDWTSMESTLHRVVQSFTTL